MQEKLFLLNAISGEESFRMGIFSNLKSLYKRLLDYLGEEPGSQTHSLVHNEANSAQDIDFEPVSGEKLLVEYFEGRDQYSDLKLRCGFKLFEIELLFVDQPVEVDLTKNAKRKLPVKKKTEN